jgi:hypothetical protein
MGTKSICYSHIQYKRLPEEKKRIKPLSSSAQGLGFGDPRASVGPMEKWKGFKVVRQGFSRTERVNIRPELQKLGVGYEAGRKLCIL